MTDPSQVPTADHRADEDVTPHSVRVRLVGDAGTARDRAADIVAGQGLTLVSVGPLSDCGPARDPAAPPTSDLVVVVAPPAAGVAAAVERVVAARITVRVVVLAPPGEIDPDVLLAALSAGADGWLTTDLPAPVLGRSLRAVVAGEPGIARHHVSHLIAALRRADHRTVVRGDGVAVEVTERENDVLAALADATSTREIGERLSISASTVRWHVARLSRKLRLDTRRQLVDLAVEMAAGGTTRRSGSVSGGLPAARSAEPVADGRTVVAPVVVDDVVTAGWASLTQSERRTVRLLALGLTNAEIAGRLVLSRHTVDTQVKRAFQKLGVHSRVELTRSAVRVEPELLHG